MFFGSTAFVLIHVGLSLIGIVTGLIVLRGLIRSDPMDAWTAAFFVLPFLAMIALSFAHMEGREVVRGFDPGNYTRIFTDPTMLGALWNSLEITVIVTVVSIILAYPLAAIIAFRVPARWQRLALLLAVTKIGDKVEDVVFPGGPEWVTF